MTTRQKNSVMILMKDLIIGTIMLIIVISLMAACTWYETYYTRQRTVINVSNNVITIMDNTKNFWCFKDSNYAVNDLVEILIDANCTDSNIYNDKIIHVKK